MEENSQKLNVEASNQNVDELNSSKKDARYRPSVSTRCAHKKIIKWIRRNLDKGNLETFKKSCFGHLMKITKLKFQGTLMLRLLENMDIGASNEEKLAFKIGKSIEFRATDFSLITGLRCYGIMSKATTAASSSIHKDVFHSRTCIHVNDIKEALRTARREGRGELALKLALLYFLYGILLASKGIIPRNDMKYFPLVDDLENFNEFPWGQVAYKFLAKSLISVRARMDGPQVPNKQIDVNGFSYAIQAWVYEVLPRVGKYCASPVSSFRYLTPRISCWSAKNRILYNDLHELFTPDDKAHSVLEGIRTRPKKKIQVGKLAALLRRLSRRQPKKKKRKFPCDKDHEMPRAKKIMRIDQVYEKLKLDEEAQHNKESVEDLVAKLDDCGAAADDEELNVNLVVRKVIGAVMSSPNEIRDNSSGSGGYGFSERGSTSLLHSDNLGKELRIRGSDASAACSDVEVPTAGDHVYEKLKLDKAAPHYKESVEDLVAKLDDCGAAAGDEDINVNSVDGNVIPAAMSSPDEEKSMRMGVDEKLKSDEAAQHNKENVEHDCNAAADAEEMNVNLVDGKVNAAAMPSPDEYSSGSAAHGLLERGSDANATRSGGEVPTAGDHAVIFISDSEDENTSKPASALTQTPVAADCVKFNDVVDLSDDDSCSSANMIKFVKNM